MSERLLSRPDRYSAMTCRLGTLIASAFLGTAASSWQSRLLAPVARRLRFCRLWPEGSLVRRKPIILCIDDNPDWLVGLKVLLGEEDYEVLVASSGSEGLELYASQPVDAVILDYQMPEMMGDRVAAQMKLAKPDVPIVLLSGHDWLPEDVLQSVDAFVAKGESPTTLLATVHDLLTVRSPFFTRWFNNWKHHTALKGSKPSHEATR